MSSINKKVLGRFEKEREIESWVEHVERNAWNGVLYSGFEDLEKITQESKEWWVFNFGGMLC